jgi:hypothetical protein
MRSLGLICLLVAAARPGIAAEPVTIEWDAARPLTWADFKGPVPAGAEEHRVASTASSLGWSYAFEIEMSEDRCTFGIVRLDSTALFHPEKSWVRPGHRTAEVLEHEQGHFDIAKLFLEKFRAATREFVGARRPCDGRSERKARRDAEREISRQVGTLYEEIWRQYELRQQTYDAETRHGIDREAQARWTETISMSLRSAAEP